MPEMLKVDEVAGLLRVSKATIQRWCAEGKLPAFKIGQHWRINAESLRRLVAELSTLEPSDDGHLSLDDHT